MTLRLFSSLYPTPRDAPVEWDASEPAVPPLESHGVPLNNTARFMSINGTLNKLVWQLDINNLADIDTLVASACQIPDLYENPDKEKNFKDGHDQETYTAHLYADASSARAGIPRRLRHGQGFYRHWLYPPLTVTLDFECQFHDSQGEVHEHAVEGKFRAGKGRLELPKLHFPPNPRNPFAWYCPFYDSEENVKRPELVIDSFGHKHIVPRPSSSSSSQRASQHPSGAAPPIVGEPPPLSTKEFDRNYDFRHSLVVEDCNCSLPPWRISQLMLQANVAGYERVDLAEATQYYFAYLSCYRKDHLQWYEETGDNMSPWFEKFFAWYWLDDASRTGPIRESLLRIVAARRKEASLRPNVPTKSAVEIDIEAILARRPDPKLVRQCQALASFATKPRTRLSSDDEHRLLDLPLVTNYADIDPLSSLVRTGCRGRLPMPLIWKICAYDLAHPTVEYHVPSRPVDTITARLCLLPTFLWDIDYSRFCIAIHATTETWKTKRYLSAPGKKLLTLTSDEMLADVKSAFLKANPSARFTDDDVYFHRIEVTSENTLNYETSYPGYGFRVTPKNQQWSVFDHQCLVRELRASGLETLRSDPDARYGGFLWNVKGQVYHMFYSSVAPAHERGGGLTNRFDRLASFPLDPSKGYGQYTNLFNLTMPGCNSPTCGRSFVLTTPCCPPDVVAQFIVILKKLGHRTKQVSAETPEDEKTVEKLVTKKMKDYKLSEEVVGQKKKATSSETDARLMPPPAKKLKPAPGVPPQPVIPPRVNFDLTAFASKYKASRKF